MGGEAGLLDGLELPATPAWLPMTVSRPCTYSADTTGASSDPKQCGQGGADGAGEPGSRVEMAGGQPLSGWETERDSVCSSGGSCGRGRRRPCAPVEWGSRAGAGGRRGAGRAFHPFCFFSAGKCRTANAFHERRGVPHPQTCARRDGEGPPTYAGTVQPWRRLSGAVTQVCSR